MWKKRNSYWFLLHVIIINWIKIQRYLYANANNLIYLVENIFKLENISFNIFPLIEKRPWKETIDIFNFIFKVTSNAM